MSGFSIHMGDTVRTKAGDVLQVHRVNYATRTAYLSAVDGAVCWGVDFADIAGVVSREGDAYRIKIAYKRGDVINTTSDAEQDAVAFAHNAWSTGVARAVEVWRGAETIYYREDDVHPSNWVDWAH